MCSRVNLHRWCTPGSLHTLSTVNNKAIHIRNFKTRTASQCINVNLIQTDINSICSNISFVIELDPIKFSSLAALQNNHHQLAQLSQTVHSFMLGVINRNYFVRSTYLYHHLLIACKLASYQFYCH